MDDVWKVVGVGDNVTVLGKDTTMTAAFCVRLL